MSTPTGSTGNPSIGELFADVSKDVSLLIRQEVELAKAELRESAAKGGRGAGELTAAVVTAHLGLVFLSVGAWWAIGNGTGRGWAGVIVGVVYLLVAAGLATVGRKDLKSVKGLPKTAESVQRIPAAMKGNEDFR